MAALFTNLNPLDYSSSKPVDNYNVKPSDMTHPNDVIEMFFLPDFNNNYEETMKSYNTEADLYAADTVPPPPPDDSGRANIRPEELYTHMGFYWSPTTRSFIIGAWPCAAYMDADNVGQIRLRMRWGIPRLVASN